MKRSTVRFDEQVLRRLKEKAAREDRTLQDLTNDLLRQALDRVEEPRPFEPQLKPWKARELPGVDICDRRSLFDIMEGR
jgi:plasmid stability protein